MTKNEKSKVDGLFFAVETHPGLFYSNTCSLVVTVK